MRVKRGYVVKTSGQGHLYKTVLEHESGERSEHPVDTIREGEALIRSRLLPPSPEAVWKTRHSYGPAQAAPTPDEGEPRCDRCASLQMRTLRLRSRRTRRGAAILVVSRRGE